MAISTVRANVNGTWYTMSLNSSNGKYEATITAPGSTSYNLPGGYYSVAVEATNDAGSAVTVDGAQQTGLRLVVKETIAPVITILSPSNGAYVANNQQPVVFTITDEEGGSGVDLSSVVVKLDNTTATSSTISSTAITNGYSFTFTPASAMADGSHTVTVTASDNDGNAATAKSSTFTVDTVPPTLNITAPADGLVTSSQTINVAGSTNDSTSSPVTVAITLNGSDQGSVTVSSDGTFTKTVTLAEGGNTLVITAMDAAGKTTSVTRNVTLNTKEVIVYNSAITPNPVDAGATMVISVTVEEV